jgi:hypothetical protein
MNKVLSLAIASVFLTATAAVTNAQTNAPGAEPRAASESGRRSAEPRPFSKPAERVEARLAYVKTALKITDNQQTLWNAYADVVRRNAQTMEQRFAQFRAQRQGRAQRPNAVERLERQQVMYTNAAARLNEILSVQKPLYEALSPEQQKVADVVLVPRQQGMPRHRGMQRMQRG